MKERRVKFIAIAMWRFTDPYNNLLPTHCRKVQLKHGADFHTIEIRTRWNPIVIDLAKEIERVLAIPYDNQKLFFNSVDLKLSPYDTLDSHYCLNNSIVRLANDMKGPAYYKKPNF